MSVKAAIKDLLPHSWDKVLRENKVLTNFCDYLYRDCVPEGWKNGKNWKYSINRIRHLTTSAPFLSCFNQNNTKEGVNFWVNISEQIENYEESCKQKKNH